MKVLRTKFEQSLSVVCHRDAPILKGSLGRLILLAESELKSGWK